MIGSRWVFKCPKEDSKTGVTKRCDVLTNVDGAVVRPSCMGFTQINKQTNKKRGQTFTAEPQLYKKGG